MASTPKTIKAKDFKYRSDLENEVRNKYGLTPDLKIDVIIEGTRDELAKLQLSDTTIFWGIKCSITDTPTQAQTKEGPDRGVKETDFGINQRNNKKK